MKKILFLLICCSLFLGACSSDKQSSNGKIQCTCTCKIQEENKENEKIIENEKDDEEKEEKEEKEENKELLIYYEAEVEFFVNPAKVSEDGEPNDTENQYGVNGSYGQAVMENMIKLLSSESFSKQLMEAIPNGVKPNVPKTNSDGSINSTYANFLRKINEAVSFSHSESFIYVSLSVAGKENKHFAETLLTAIKTEVPAYVEKYMVVPSGYDFTKCVKTSVLDEIQEITR